MQSSHLAFPATRRWNEHPADTSVQTCQSTGVRQGGPDSPVAFSALVGGTLLKTQSKVTISAWGPDAKKPPPTPKTSGHMRHMDDVYVWGENPKHVQQVVDILEKLFAGHGLFVNHKKTCAIANEGTYTFQVGGHPVPLLHHFVGQPPEAAMWGAPTWPLHESHSAAACSEYQDKQERTGHQIHVCGLNCPACRAPISWWFALFSGPPVHALPGEEFPGHGV